MKSQMETNFQEKLQMIKVVYFFYLFLQIKNQNQQLIREKVANVQKRIQEQKAEQRRKNLTNDVVQTVEKQVEY